MKKILIVSPVVSHPALSGNSTRVNQTVACLQGLGHEVHFLLTPIPFMQDRRAKNEMVAHFGANYRELNDGQVITGNASHRAWRTMLRLGMRKVPVARDISLTSGIFSKKNKQEFAQIVSQVDPDLVLFEYVLLAELADQLGGRRKTVVDTHDRFSNRNRRIRAAGGTGTWWSLRPAQEKRLLSSFDHALAIQQNEHALFAADLAGSKTHAALVDILHVPLERHAPNTPANLVLGFIGSNNQHNVEGLFQFIDHQWPHIARALPGARLVVAGGIASDRKIPNVAFVGRVDELWRDFYSQCSVIVNPCLSGTGLKIKTVEAMSYGLPVVTTREGCSGIESAIGQGIVCSDLATAAFHEACIALLQDDEKRANQACLARTYIESAMHNSVARLQSILQ